MAFLAFDVASARLQAAVIYTNLLPGDSFLGAYTAEDSSGPFSVATEFTASSTAQLWQILTPISDDLGMLTFDLYTNASGKPGTLLEQWTNVSVPPTPTGFDPIPLLTLTSVANPLLSSGSTYWFVANAQSNSGELAWGVNLENVPGGLWGGNTSTLLTQNYSTEAAPAIEADSVPEPATWILLTCGFALLAARRVAVRL